MLNRRLLLIASALAALPSYLLAGYNLICKQCDIQKPKYRLIDDDPKPVEPGKPKPKPKPGIKKRKTNTKGLHSHVCRGCIFEFWHVSGSHYCPRCGRGPWYTISQGTSLDTRRRLFR